MVVVYELELDPKPESPAAPPLLPPETSVELPEVEFPEEPLDPPAAPLPAPPLAPPEDSPLPPLLDEEEVA